MIEKIKSMRGVLYRKLKKKKPVSPPLPPRREAKLNTRAARMISILRQEEQQQELVLKSEFPKFIIYRDSFLQIKKFDFKKNIVYPLIPPYAYANIVRNPIDGSVTYNVIEPKLTKEEQKIFEKIKEGLIQTIDISLELIKKENTVLNFLEKKVQHLIKNEYGFKITPQQYLKIMYYVYRDFVGLNRIHPLIFDPLIEDIGVDGIGIPVYVVHQKLGSVKTNIVYHNPEELRNFVVKLAERCGRYISYAEPLLDGTLPDGARVQASLSEDVTTRGPTFSIRKFREKPFTPVDMINLGTASADVLAYLWFVVENNANVLICGGVASGKTSLLNCISLFIPPEAKVISIEDTRELNLPHENWIPGVSRMGFAGTNVGEVTMFDLLKESFRQNPDYLIVGEVRGEEAMVMFQGMASGHPSISTIHAGGVDDVIKRLETPPINLSPGLLEILDIVITMVHAREKGKSARRIKQIDEIEAIDKETGKARYNRVFSWVPFTDGFEYKGNSWVLEKISKNKGVPMTKIMEEINNRKKVLRWLVYSDIKDWKKIAEYIHLYYRNKKKVLELVEENKF